jgi:hypothetical protein
MKVIEEDILNVTEGYIIHQTNCISCRPCGLAYSIEEKFPGTCPYLLRKSLYKNINVCQEKDKSIPGTISIVKCPNTEVTIINLFGQYRPGPPSYGKSYYDDSISRENYFEQGLDRIVNFFNGARKEIKVSIPYNIGCGLAKGKWENYEWMLNDFERKCIESGIEINITLYKI